MLKFAVNTKVTSEQVILRKAFLKSHGYGIQNGVIKYKANCFLELNKLLLELLLLLSHSKYKFHLIKNYYTNPCNPLPFKLSHSLLFFLATGLWSPFDISRQPFWHDPALLNKPGRCAWFSGSAFDIWRLRLLFRAPSLMQKTNDCEVEQGRCFQRWPINIRYYYYVTAVSNTAVSRWQKLLSKLQREKQLEIASWKTKKRHWNLQCQKRLQIRTFCNRNRNLQIFRALLHN